MRSHIKEFFSKGFKFTAQTIDCEIYYTHNLLPLIGSNWFNGQFVRTLFYNNSFLRVDQRHALQMAGWRAAPQWYRGTSLSNSARPGPCSTNMPRALLQSCGDGHFLMSEVPLQTVGATTLNPSHSRLTLRQRSLCGRARLDPSEPG